MNITMPCISIRHLSFASKVRLGAALNGIAWPSLFAAHDNGYFLVAPSMDERHDLPSDLQAIFAYTDPLAVNGWISIDVDGDVVDTLLVYGGAK